MPGTCPGACGKANVEIWLQHVDVFLFMKKKISPGTDFYYNKHKIFNSVLVDPVLQDCIWVAIVQELVTVNLPPPVEIYRGANINFTGRLDAFNCVYTRNHTY